MTKDMTGGPQTPPLPGPCVPIPHARTQVIDARGQPRWLVETHIVPDLDLDGAGSPVVLVPPARDEITLAGMFWRLFIQRGPCGHELGLIPGLAEPEAEAGESHGLRDLTVVEPLDETEPSALAGVGVTVYRFDGQRYVGGVMDYR